MIISNKKKGFTLIELLVVISIIGLLSSVVLASLNSARAKSRDARRISDIRQIRNALELYKDATGYYPTTLGALVTANYIKIISPDPSSAAGVCRPTYCYSTNLVSNATGYHLGALMETVNNNVLSSDSDFDSSSSYYNGGVLSGFDGDVPSVYDIKY